MLFGFLVHSLGGWYLCHFWSLGIVKKATTDSHIQALVWPYIFISSAFIPESEITGLYGKCVFKAVGSCQTFFKVVVTICIPASKNEGSSCFTSSPPPWYYSGFFFPLKNGSNSNKHTVASDCGFKLHFPDAQWCWISLSVLIFLPWSVSAQILCTFQKTLRFESLYIFGIENFYQDLIKYFLLSVACFININKAAFRRLELLTLMQSINFILLWIVILVSYIRKLWWTQGRTQRFSPVFSSRIFIVLSAIFSL